MENILQRIVNDIRRREKDEFDGFNAATFPLRLRTEPININPLLKDNGENSFFLIAETKKGSPSKGVLREDYHPAEIAGAYENAGASAISVITESGFFHGEKEHLSHVRRAVKLPLLRKDFIIHPRQIYESYNLGADFILLIAACLSSDEISSFQHIAHSLGLSVLLEVRSAPEITRVLPLNPQIIGINNRDLTTFKVNPETSFTLKKWIPPEIPVISESGINSPELLRRLRQTQFAGALIGESLITAPDPGQALRDLLHSAFHAPSRTEALP